MYRILYLNLDGALLNDKQEISPYLLSTLHEIIPHCKVILGTKRHHIEVKPYYDELELDTPIICCGGAYLYNYHHQSITQEQAIAKNLAQAFIDLAQSYDLTVVMHSTDAIVYSTQSQLEYMNRLSEWANQHQTQVPPNIYQIDSFHDYILATRCLWKLVVQGDTSHLIHFASHPLIQETFHCTTQYPRQFEFTSPLADTTRQFQEYLSKNGWSMWNTCAVSTSKSDRRLLKEAGFSITLNDSAGTLKTQADEICLNEESKETLAHTLHQILLET